MPAAERSMSRSSGGGCPSDNEQDPRPDGEQSTRPERRPDNARWSILAKGSVAAAVDAGSLEDAGALAGFPPGRIVRPLRSPYEFATATRPGLESRNGRRIYRGRSESISWTALGHRVP